METKQLTLSSAGLQNIIQGEQFDDTDFCFILCKKHMKMKRMYAEFISPIVSKLHRADFTINTIKLDDHFNDHSDNFNNLLQESFTDDIISIIQQLSSGCPVNVTAEQCFKLQFVSVLLDNAELFTKSNELFPCNLNELNVDLYIQNVMCCYYFSKFKKEFDFTSILNFLASNFFFS